MPQPLVYIDTAEVRTGKLAPLKVAMKKLADFVERSESDLVSYSVYFSGDKKQMTVVHVHADSASLEYHMDTAGPLFHDFADLVRLTSIHIYGQPSERALVELRKKLRLLGTGDVIVHPLHAGFVRALPERETAM